MIDLRHRKGFETLLEECKLRRLEELARRFDQKPRCLSLSTEEQALYRELECLLPQERKPLLLRYSDLSVDLLALQQQYFYHHGFLDGCTLSKVFGRRRRRPSIV